MNLLKELERMKVEPDRREKEKYCLLYHDHHGHPTKVCIRIEDKIVNCQSETSS